MMSVESVGVAPHPRTSSRPDRDRTRTPRHPRAGTVRAPTHAHAHVPTHDPVALTRRIRPYSTKMHHKHHKHMHMHIL